MAIAGTSHANNPPTVSLSASAMSITLGTSTTLKADAADRDGSIVRVTFFDGATVIAQVSSAPYTYAYTPATPGMHVITAIAVDNQLAQTVSNALNLAVTVGGNLPPTVSLAATLTTLTTGQTTTLTANASDPDGTIAKVVFTSNGAAVATVTAPPFTYNYQPSAAGAYNLTAVATDNGGASATSNIVQISVSDPVRGGGSPPTVSVTANPTTVVLGSATSLSATATATGANNSIAKVEFYNGSTLISTDTTSPYTANFTPSSTGTYSVTARAYDSHGVTATSTAVTVTATANPAATLPRITLTLSNTLFSPGGVVTLSANASAVAPNTVAKVSFFMNGSKLVDDTTSPYSTTATLTNAGQYTFYALVTDSAGQTQITLNQVAVAQNAPAVVTTDPDVVRLLNQATFGFSQAEAARVNSLGIAGWITDQMSQPISGYPDTKYNTIQLTTSANCTTTMPNGQAYPGDSPQAICARDQLTLAGIQRDFFTNALYAPDQLRQRVAWALSQIVVTSGNEGSGDLTFAYVMSRYQNIMFNNAFGNYQTLLNQVTYNPAMGQYLTMVNNDRAPAPPTTSTRVPNENYAREIMQLFSINLVELNTDGTPILDASGNPIPTYDQSTIKEFAKVFTGYTFANSLTQTSANGKQQHYYAAPMVPYPTTNNAGHDPNQKTLLNGTVLPAGQTGKQDIDAAVLNVFMHPNTGVYIGKQLIQHLVTGNPTPAYVARITAVFNDNGQGVRGDLAAVVKAILLDPEARGPAKTASDFGSLREPVLSVTSLIRALNGLTDGNRLAGATSNLSQNPYFSPTVFNYYMPDTVIPNTMITGPEFGIHTTVTAVGRANLIYALVYGGYNPDPTIPNATGTKLFLAPFEAIADNPAAMVSLLNQQMTGGQFPAALEPTIVTAVNAITISSPPTAAERTNRARMAVYLMASSYDYQVQR
ncbi:MAG TPA: DUF1800 family protein [Casimicrobiaceae bacterium]|nr:DUF1800 family protein [Casimicrobiaceae bacterium]